jgi:hypothetical protein
MLFRLLKNASKWVFKQLEKSGQAIADAEDRMIASMFIEKDDYDSKEK